MLTVSIFINGHPIYTRSVVREVDPIVSGGNARYRNDDGKIIVHNPDDGAIELAIKALQTIKEVK